MNQLQPVYFYIYIGILLDPLEFVLLMGANQAKNSKATNAAT